jgi:hypothetical protein
MCEDFMRDGFVVLRNFFTPSDVKRFRDAAAGMPAEPNVIRYIYELPGMEEYWCDGRLLEMANQILGSPVVFFFDSNMQKYNFVAGEPVHGRHMHHDAKGTQENLFNRFNAPADRPYPVIRCATYLQDTAGQSGGLKIVPGSHLRDVSHFDARELASYNVPTTPGDLIVFSHRLLHSPFGLRLKSEPERALAPADEDILSNTQPALFLPMPMVRETLFIDYAAMDELADIHLKNRALMSFQPDSTLSAFLVDRGFLDRHAGHPVLFRVDRAIVETVDNVRRNIAGDQATAAAVEHLRRLPRLCKAHWEWSPHYTLLDTEVTDDSMETAVRLFNTLEPRIQTLRATRAGARPDPHMGAFSHAQLKAMAAKATKP